MVKDVKNTAVASGQSDQRQTLWICYAHKMILSQHSVMFHDLFKSDDQNKSEYDVMVNDFTAFRALLKYFYEGNPCVLWGENKKGSGSCNVANSDYATACLLSNVILLLDKYKVIPPVMNTAVQKAISIISPKTLTTFFSTAVNIRNLKLGSACYIYVIDHLKSLEMALDKVQYSHLIDIIESFLKLFLLQSVQKGLCVNYYSKLNTPC